MIWTLIGTLMVGVLAASLTFIGFHLARRSAPRWTLPAAAGLAMLAFHISSDYAWFARTTAAFPPHLEVGETYTSRSILQPWTLLRPPIDRFSAVDTRTIQRNPAVPELVMAELALLTRYYPTVVVTQLYDCSEPRRADAGPSLRFDENGRPTNAEWVAIDADDAVRRLVCAEAERGDGRRPEPSATTTTATRRSVDQPTREQPTWPSRRFSSSTTSPASASI